MRLPLKRQNGLCVKHKSSYFNQNKKKLISIIENLLLNLTVVDSTRNSRPNWGTVVNAIEKIDFRLAGNSKKKLLKQLMANLKLIKIK